MKITALIENTTNDNYYETEHGLSLYIETAKHNILFDMGQTDMFLRNAHKLGINLADVDVSILSHGHYDHGGGLEKFLDINKKACVYLSQYAFEPHYNGTKKYIGLDTALKNDDRLIFTEDMMTIDDNLILYSCNNNIRNHNLGSFGLTTMQNNEFLPDDFRHEQYLLIEENHKKFLISGCSHKGIMDIAQWFKPDVLVGGFHFSKLPLDETLEKYARYLNDFNIDFYTCHCTGVEQFNFMKNYMTKLHYLSTGESIIF